MPEAALGVGIGGGDLAQARQLPDKRGVSQLDHSARCAQLAGDVEATAHDEAAGPHGAPAGAVPDVSETIIRPGPAFGTAQRSRMRRRALSASTWIRSPGSWRTSLMTQGRRTKIHPSVLIMAAP
jgi:hypothetical protein